MTKRLSELERQTRLAIERCGLAPSAMSFALGAMRSNLSLGPFVASLAFAKRQLLREGAGDSELAGIDELIALALSQEEAQKTIVGVNAELFALLPPLFIGQRSPEVVFKSSSEPLTPNPMHVICELIGERGLLAHSQEDLFAPVQMSVLAQSLRECGLSRPDWINARDQLGQTPLHWAVYYLAPEALCILLDLGANPELENSFGSPAFDPAFFERYCRSEPSPPKAQERARTVWRLMERYFLERFTDKGEQGEGAKRL